MWLLLMEPIFATSRPCPGDGRLLRDYGYAGVLPYARVRRCWTLHWCSRFAGLLASCASGSSSERTTADTHASICAPAAVAAHAVYALNLTNQVGSVPGRQAIKLRDLGAQRRVSTRGLDPVGVVFCTPRARFVTIGYLRWHHCQRVESEVV